MPLPHSTLYFSPNTISVVSRNTIHQHRIRELAEPENMKLHTAYVTMDTIEKTERVTVPNPAAVASAAAAPFRSHGVAAARAITRILLGEISWGSQRIDSTQNRGWVVQSRDWGGLLFQCLVRCSVDKKRRCEELPPPEGLWKPAVRE